MFCSILILYRYGYEQRTAISAHYNKHTLQNRGTLTRHAKINLFSVQSKRGFGPIRYHTVGKNGETIQSVEYYI
jgi:hypothetical protein